MRTALRCAAVWLAAALIAVFISMSWALDSEPSETDALRASTLDLHDAIQQARAASKEE